jgi:hypothetical protein
VVVPSGRNGQCLFDLVGQNRIGPKSTISIRQSSPPFLRVFALLAAKN